MIDRQSSLPSTDKPAMRAGLDHKLAVYLGAASSSLLASEAAAVVVSNSTPQPFGINEEVDIDFNSDGQIDFQLDHDRVNVNGVDLDYLQIDKNDLSSAADPYTSDGFATFPVPDGQSGNWDHGYLTNPQNPGEIGHYPAALLSGAEIGTLGNWDFQEGDNFAATETTIRANRLIDEDMTQIDAANPSPPPESQGQTAPLGEPGWVGLSGETRYLGVRIDLNDMNFPDNEFPTINGPDDTDDPLNYNYGWIGVRIDNEDDATGAVTGWGYQTEPGAAILAGETAPALTGDYNGNGTVDAADYTIWRDNLGLTGGATPSQGDGNNDGNVNQDDYLVWKTSFGDSSAGTLAAVGSAAAVPEPSSLLLGIFAGLALVGSFLCRRFARR